MDMETTKLREVFEARLKEKDAIKDTCFDAHISATQDPEYSDVLHVILNTNYDLERNKEAIKGFFTSLAERPAESAWVAGWMGPDDDPEP